MKYRLRIRTYPECRHVSVWVIRADGAAESGLLWGELLQAAAEELATALGLEVERQSCPVPGAEAFKPPECAPLAQQRLLFDVAAP